MAHALPMTLGELSKYDWVDNYTVLFSITIWGYAIILYLDEPI